MAAIMKQSIMQQSIKYITLLAVIYTDQIIYHDTEPWSIVTINHSNTSLRTQNTINFALIDERLTTVMMFTSGGRRWRRQQPPNVRKPRQNNCRAGDRSSPDALRGLIKSLFIGRFLQTNHQKKAKRNVHLFRY